MADDQTPDVSLLETLIVELEEKLGIPLEKTRNKMGGPAPEVNKKVWKTK